jgi:hypothetical protein
LVPLLELDGLAARVGETRQAVDGLLAHRVLRRRSADVSGESLLRGAWAAAAMTGSAADLASVRDGRSEDPIVQGALRVSTELGGLAEIWPHAPRQALARLHALAAIDQIAAADLGRPRDDAEVAARLDLMSDVLAATSAPAAVVAAVVEGELLGLDAFPPVTPIVSFAAARLTLISRGLDPKSLVVLEVGHYELADEFVPALAAYRSGTPNGVSRWVGYCMSALQFGVREALAICEAIQRG